MPRVIHFELAAREPERLAKFYGDVFGWTATKWEGPAPYWLVSTGTEGTPGINGGIFSRSDGQGVGETVNVIDVPSVDEYLAKITDHGGTVVMPKMAVPTVGYLAYCKDTEGTLFGIMQFDQAAQ